MTLKSPLTSHTSASHHIVSEGLGERGRERREGGREGVGVCGERVLRSTKCSLSQCVLSVCVCVMSYPTVAI